VKNKKLLKLLGAIGLLVLIASLLMLGCAKPAPAPAPAPAPEVFEITFTSNIGEASVTSQAMKWWAGELEKRTQGQVKVVQMTFGGALLKSDTIVQGIGKGIADVGYFSATYTPAEFPLANALTAVYLNDGIGIGAMLYKLYATTPELKAEFERNNLMPVYLRDGTQRPINTNFPLTSLEDLKAKNIRAYGTEHLLFANWGAVPVKVAAADTYVALQKGTVDGNCGLPYHYLKTQKLAEVITQTTSTSFDCYAMWTGAIMNLDTYNSFPDSVKEVINELSVETTEWVARGEKEQGFEGLDYAKELGVDIVVLSPEKADEWWEAADVEGIWGKYIQDAEEKGVTAARPVFEKLVELVREYDEAHPRKLWIEEWGDSNPGVVKILK